MMPTISKGLNLSYYLIRTRKNNDNDVGPDYYFNRCNEPRVEHVVICEAKTDVQLGDTCPFGLAVHARHHSKTEPILITTANLACATRIAPKKKKTKTLALCLVGPWEERDLHYLSKGEVKQRRILFFSCV